MVCYWNCVGQWHLVNLTSSFLTGTISFFVILADLVDKREWTCKKSVWCVAASVVCYVAASVAAGGWSQSCLCVAVFSSHTEWPRVEPCLTYQLPPWSLLLHRQTRSVSLNTLVNLVSRINFHHDPCFYTARQGLCHSQHSGKPCLTYQLPPWSLFLHRQTRSVSLSTLW